MSENTKSKMTEKKEQRKRLEQQIRFIIGRGCGCDVSYDHGTDP